MQKNAGGHHFQHKTQEALIRKPHSSRAPSCVFQQVSCVLTCNAANYDRIKSKTREHSSPSSLTNLFLFSVLLWFSSQQRQPFLLEYSFVPAALSLSRESAETDTVAGSPWVGCSPALHSAASTAHYRWCHRRCQS